MGTAINDEMCRGISSIDLNPAPPITDFNGDTLQIGDHVLFASGGRLAEGRISLGGLNGLPHMVMIDSLDRPGRTAVVWRVDTIKVAVE